MPKGLPISYIKKWGISKLAWKKFRAGALTKGVPTRTASIEKRLKGENPKKRGIKMARRRYFPRRRSRRGGMTIPIAPIVGLVPMVYPSLDPLMRGNWMGALDMLCWNTLGVADVPAGRPRFDAGKLVMNITPLIVGLLVHKFVGGKPLNLNATLAKAKVPLIRI